MKIMRKKNERGMSILDVMIGISILGFFVAFLPQALMQAQRQSQRAAIKTDLTRLRQIILIGARNVDRIKKSIIQSVGPAKNQLLNCFGQSVSDAIGNPLPLPKGLNCDLQFSQGKTWALLAEIPPVMFNKKWTLKSECVTAGDVCMLETSAWYYFSCESERCHSIHLEIRMTPTDAMLALKNTVAGENLSSDDFAEKKTEIIFPGAIFGTHHALTRQKCTDPNTFLEFLSADYNQFYCNPDMSNSASCGTSVLNLNGGCGSQTLASDTRMVGGTFSSGGGPISTLSTGNKAANELVPVTLCAKPEGSHGFKIDPQNPTQTMVKPFPDFSLGNKVQISCGSAFSVVTFTAASDSETSPPLYCQTQPVLVSTLSAYSSIDCLFAVLSSSNAQIGNASTATLKINPTPSGAGPPGPLSTPNPLLTPLSETEIESGEI